MASTHGKDPFEYIAPNDESTSKIIAFRAACKTLNDLILGSIPNSRERAVAITKLEEVSMWGNKAIVFNQDGTAE